MRLPHLVSGLNEEEQVVQGFHMGADDYVTKPFSMRILIMKIQAVWRRGLTIEREPIRRLSIGDMTIDAESHEVLRDGEAVALTVTEFRILYLLASNLGRVVSSARLVDYAWGHEGGHPSLLKTHISHIRTKLGLPTRGPGGIDVLPMVGYRLTAVADEQTQPHLVPAGPGCQTAVSRGERRQPLRLPTSGAVSDVSLAIHPDGNLGTEDLAMVAVGPGRDEMERDPAPLDRRRPLEPLLA